MGLLEKLLDFIDFEIKGSKKVLKPEEFVCKLVPSYSLSNLVATADYVKAKIGISYHNYVLTTFSSATVYHDCKPYKIYNKDKVCTLYINNGYLHLPDVIASYLVKLEQPFFGFTKDSVFYFDGKILTAYKYASIPHYTYSYDFGYTDDLEKLLRLIGLVDVSKRCLYQKKQFKKMYFYYLSPFVHFASFLVNKTTLFPRDLSMKITSLAVDEFKNYIDLPKNEDELIEEIKKLEKSIDLTKLLY